MSSLSAIIAGIPQRMAKLLPGIIRQQQAKGLIRKEADPKWLALSLIGLMITPFLGAVVRTRAWKISDDEVSSEAWAEHICVLFSTGALTEKPPHVDP